MIPDLILTLAGEDRKERHRSKRTLELYVENEQRTPIILTGSHSGLLGRNVPQGMEPECLQMRDYLIKKRVSPNQIRIEGQSLDTFANFYYSAQLIEREKKYIDLVTDWFHMPRALWCAQRVFGKSKILTPRLADETEPTRKAALVERLMTNILAADCMLYHIQPGNYTRLTTYMNEVHPFHHTNEKPLFSFYGLWTGMMRRWGMGLAKKVMPSQAQAYRD